MTCFISTLYGILGAQNELTGELSIIDIHVMSTCQIAYFFILRWLQGQKGCKTVSILSFFYILYETFTQYYLI